MQLGYILQNLTYGELKQVGVGGHDDGAIQPENYKEVIGHINLAMQNLYSRFPLDEKEFLLKTVLGKTIYQLTPNNAISQNLDGFILDTVTEPFTGDILRIHSVFNEVGCEVPLNDMGDANSFYLPSYDKVQIPRAQSVATFAFIYRANPEVVTVPEVVTDLDLTQEVRLPQVLLEALLVYISYRIYKGQGGEQGTGLAQAAKQHYERLCLEVETGNLLNNASNNANLKPELNGWV